MIEIYTKIDHELKDHLLKTGKIAFFDNSADKLLTEYFCCFVNTKDSNEAINKVINEFGCGLDKLQLKTKVVSRSTIDSNDWLITAIYEDATNGKIEGMIRRVNDL